METESRRTKMQNNRLQIQVVDQAVSVVRCPEGLEALRFLENCGRVCSKTEDRITPDSASNFIENIIKRGHESVIEHLSATAYFICSRSISHEIVRHRLASYSQESTRYCNYCSSRLDFTLTFVRPPELQIDTDEYEIWYKSVEESAYTYFTLIENGVNHQVAREVLPFSLKTELIMTANLREWRHFLRLRMAKDAHSAIRLLAKSLYFQLSSRIPIVFDDLKELYLSD